MQFNPLWLAGAALVVFIASMVMIALTEREPPRYYRTFNGLSRAEVAFKTHNRKLRFLGSVGLFIAALVAVTAGYLALRWSAPIG
jgi:hypothetical protein